MSQPRAIVPGATYLLTRRVLRRHFLLRPDSAITRLVVYSLAVSAQRYGILVHALCVMSTHLHLVATDTRGELPRFLQRFHRIVALGAKILRAWEGPVWDHDATSVVHLSTRDALVAKIAYTLANPSIAGLVEHAHEWPGAKVLVRELGCGTLRAQRPEIYFNPKNPEWTEEAAIPITLPPMIENSDAERFRREVAARIDLHERQARTTLKQRGLSFLGRARAGKISPYKRATIIESIRGLNPTFAVGRGQTDARNNAIAAIHTFRIAYRKSLEQWRAGVRDTIFPIGTWWMRVFHGVSVGRGELTEAWTG
ncbi:transposase [Sorangium sp. So ce341]|uniref:transposase n=1 Tax=Sorangium sp. So ce341 TaxID=3133302 RepID=UPI003F61850B